MWTCPFRRKHLHRPACEPQPPRHARLRRSGANTPSLRPALSTQAGHNKRLSDYTRGTPDFCGPAHLSTPSVSGLSRKPQRMNTAVRKVKDRRGAVARHRRHGRKKEVQIMRVSSSTNSPGDGGPHHPSSLEGTPPQKNGIHKKIWCFVQNVPRTLARDHRTPALEWGLPN